MPAETITAGAAPQLVRPQGQVNPSPPPPQTVPPEPTETEQQIKELEDEIEQLRQELSELIEHRQRLISESTGQMLLANAMRNSEEAQKDDGPPVDEFDNNSMFNKQAFSMADAMSYRSLSKAREAIYGEAVTDIREKSATILELEGELDALKNPT